MPTHHGAGLRGGALIVGIVGGIAAGKSTVVAMFVECGADAIDADREAHQVLEEPDVVNALAEWLGPQVLTAGGQVDRAYVAKRVFADAQALERLEQLIHPRVARVIEERVRRFRTQSDSPVLVLDVPLLLESEQLAGLCDAFVFVDASRELRASRAAARGWSAEELEQREKFQITTEEKRRRADVSIDTSGTLEDTRHQVQTCFGELVRRDPGQAAKQ